MDDVNQSIRSLLSRYWPVLGSFYLVYLALQSPPSRYVGVGGLVLVTPLLVGWAVGHLFGVGPWAPGSDTDEDSPDPGTAG